MRACVGVVPQLRVMTVTCATGNSQVFMKLMETLFECAAYFALKVLSNQKDLA